MDDAGNARGARRPGRAPARAGRARRVMAIEHHEHLQRPDAAGVQLQLGALTQINAIHVDLYSDIDPDQGAQRDPPHVRCLPAQPEPGARRGVHQGAQRYHDIVLNGSRVVRPRGPVPALRLVGQRLEDRQGRRHHLHVSGHRRAARTRCSSRSSIRPASRALARHRPSPSHEDDHEATRLKTSGAGPC